MEITKEYLYETYIVRDMSQAKIAKELGTTESRIDYWTKKYGLQYKKSDPDRVFNLKHINKEDPIFCYYAGLVATDGYLDYKNKRIAVRVGNQGSNEVLEALRNYFEFVRPIRHYVSKANGHTNHELQIPNQCIFKELESMGIEGKKNIRAFDVTWFMSASEDCQRMFLRGVSDGDGHIERSGAFAIAMGSYDFIDNLVCVINAVFGFSYSRKLKLNNTGKRYPLLSMRKNDSLTLYKFMYDRFSEYRFTDKYNKYVSKMKI